MNHDNTLVPFKQGDLELVIDNKTGEVFASQRAIARMCEVVDTTIMRWASAASIKPKMARILTVSGLQGAALYSETDILEAFAKYKPELLIQCAKLGLRLYLHTFAGYKVTSSAIDRPIWLKRLALNPASNIPKGYFSIFNETVIIMAKYEEKGFVFPDNMIPDISVGKCWINYLNANHIEYGRKQYKHNAPNPHIKSVDVWCYNLDLLGIFRKWYDAEYEPAKLLPYMSKNKLITPEIASKMLDLPLLN